MRACVHAHVIVCTHMEKEHACVHACESVQIQVPAMRVLRIACLADAADISCLDARLFKSKFCISLDKQEVYVLKQNEVLVGYVVYLEIDAVIWVKRLGGAARLSTAGLRHTVAAPCSSDSCGSKCSCATARTREQRGSDSVIHVGWFFAG